MNRPTPHIIALLLAAALSLASAAMAMPQRKITPVNNAATATQPVNENANDTARINARMRASMAHYHDADGNVIYIDTITGREWRDSSALNAKKPMQYPLFESVSASIDLWNPVMRCLGQRYGLVDFSAELSMHNRYKAIVEFGLGMADNTPADNNYTYRSPVSTYYKVGFEYNFLYNSTSDYQMLIGARLGISPFRYSLTGITIDSPYWDETATPAIPQQKSTAEWCEITAGLRVKLWGPIYAGWNVRYHILLHESKAPYGKPWYIPGFGTRGTPISGSFSITYTIPLNKKEPPKVNSYDSEPVLYLPETTGQPSEADIDIGIDAQNPE